MNVINTKGFNIDDKINIANDYLIPELLKTYKYDNKICFTIEIITYIIKNYTNNEEGVRNLKRCLDNIISKVNMYDLLFDNSTNKSNLELSLNQLPKGMYVLQLISQERIINHSVILQ